MTNALGALPPGWADTRLDRIATVNARIGWKALTASEYQSDGYAFLATPNIKGPDIDYTNVNYISDYRYNESPDLKLQVGDVLLAKDGNTLGIVNIVRHLPRAATVNGSIAVLRAFDMEPRFLRYAIQTSFIQGYINSVKDGMGVPHLFQRDIKRFPLPAPPLEEQRRIADFLDVETARIDRLVSLQKRLDNLLTERDRSLRDGLLHKLFATEGEKPLRRVVLRIEQGTSPQCEATPAGPGEWGVLKLSAVKYGRFDPAENKRLPDEIAPTKAYEVEAGDLLVTRANTPSLVGDVAVVGEGTSKLLLPDLIYRVRLTDTVNAEFVTQVALGRRTRALIEAAARGSSQSMVKLRGEDIKTWPIPNVGKPQQMEFLHTIRQGTAQTQRLRHLVQRQLALLAERRQALITAAVTGQFDVSTASGRNVTEGVSA